MVKMIKKNFRQTDFRSTNNYYILVFGCFLRKNT